jgi:hypothetical protein
LLADKGVKEGQTLISSKKLSCFLLIHIPKFKVHIVHFKHVALAKLLNIRLLAPSYFSSTLCGLAVYFVLARGDLQRRE